MIRLDWRNATAGAVGARHGVSAGELRGMGSRVSRAHQDVLAEWADGKLGYTDLPADKTCRRQVKELVARRRRQTTDLVVLGIGGSALGSIALQTALNPVTYNLLSPAQRRGPRLFVLDNVDPALVADTLALVGPRLKTTLFNVISKSGETAETASQFMIVREMLRRRLGRKFASRIIATTDAAKGTLHDIAARDGYETLPVPDGVGGRFSVLSAVGLFSAAMCGIDVDALLAGAARMARRVRRRDWRQNPACVLAAVKHRMMTRKGKPIHVMMPYSNRLAGLADWYRQLWAESLGKRLDGKGRQVFVGPTPVKALGATDQHSQIQLYREGPNDKLVIFLDVAEHPRDVTVPDCFADVPGLEYLRGLTLSELLSSERTATEYALAEAKRPSVTLRFDRIGPGEVGEFIFLYEFVTSLTGKLLGVDAYDQPAVQLGKDATFALVRREGYQGAAAEILARTKTDREYVV